MQRSPCLQANFNASAATFLLLETLVRYSAIHSVIRTLTRVSRSFTVVIAVGKEGVKFSVSGELGSGNMTLRQYDLTDTREGDKVTIEMQAPIAQSFALRYLNLFARATPLSETVWFKLSNDVPLVVEYPIGIAGHIRFYLAPKMEE